MTQAPEFMPVKPHPRYATFIPSRGYGIKMQFKVHNTFGQAKNATTNFARYTGGGFECDMVIYELDEEEKEYRPLLRIAKGTTREDYPDLAPKPISKRQREYQARFAEEAAQRQQEYANKAMAKAQQMRAELEAS